MRATTADDAFEFRILERGGKIIAQVYRRSAHSFDTTGKAERNPDWAFASIDEAKAWAQRHCAEVLKVPATALDVTRGRNARTGAGFIRGTLSGRNSLTDGTA